MSWSPIATSVGIVPKTQSGKRGRREKRRGAARHRPSAFLQSRRGGPSVVPRRARIGRNCDARPLWLTMFSGRKPSLGSRPLTSFRTPLRRESVHVPSVRSQSTDLCPVDKTPVDSRCPPLSILPAAANLCLPVRVCSRADAVSRARIFALEAARYRRNCCTSTSVRCEI